MNDAGVDAAEAEGLAGWGADEAKGIVAEALGELGAAGVGFGGDFEHGVTDGKLSTRREVVLAEVDVDDELVAGEGPVVLGLGKQGDEAGVDDGDLGGGVGAATRGAGAAAVEPAVAEQASVDVKHAFGDDFALFDAGTADDHAEGSGVGGGPADVGESGVQFIRVEMPGSLR